MSETLIKIDRTVKSLNMLVDGETVVAGVSGGADSMLLLYYLVNKCNCNLIVANVEHGIRGEASKADSSFVKDFCSKNKIRFEMYSFDAVKEAAEHKMGVEEYSRKVRYDFFRSFGADKIAVAHNLSDSIETLLFRLARGTSIKGLAGIPPVRDNIIRPLINCTSEEIRRACNELKIDYVIDETNSENTYSRNFVRNVIVPEFKKLNPSFEEAASRLIQSAAEDDYYIEKCAENCLNGCAESVSVNMLKQCDVAVQKRVISQMAANYGVTPDAIHLNQALELLKSSKKLQLKDNVFLASSGDTLRIYNAGECKKSKLEFEIIEYDEMFRAGEQNYKNMFCDADKIAGKPCTKKREAGDSISPMGRGCTKTLKKLFNELHIPAEQRDSLHIISDDNGVIAVAGYAVDERVKPDSCTKRIMLFNISTED